MENQNKTQGNHPHSDPNTNLTIKLMLQGAVNNPSQPYEERPGDSYYTLRKNKTVEELIASMNKKHLQAVENFLEKHPVTVTGHNYQKKGEGVTAEEASEHAQTTPFYGPFMRGEDQGCVCQIGHDGSETVIKGWCLWWGSDDVGIYFNPGGYQLKSFWKTIELTQTKNEVAYHIHEDGSLGDQVEIED